jgi:hypothetical protein
MDYLNAKLTRDANPNRRCVLVFLAGRPIYNLQKRDGMKNKISKSHIFKMLIISNISATTQPILTILPQNIFLWAVQNAAQYFLFLQYYID